MEINRKSFKLNFRIHERPGGGYIADSEDPPISLEADSREEIEAKIRDKIMEITGVKVAFGMNPGQSSVQTQSSKTMTVSLKSTTPSQGLPTQHDLSVIRLESSPGFFSGSAGLVRLGVGILIGAFAVLLWMKLTGQ